MRLIEIRIVGSVGFENGVNSGKQHPANSNNRFLVPTTLFEQKIANIATLLKEVEKYEGERIEKIKARIMDNLQKIAEKDYDKNRFEQEMIYYIEKLDVNEEKNRLDNHLKYFISTMESGHGQGKKLGFIAQEIGREINTMGSKANDHDIQKLVVKMKDELEKIKEQSLNVL